MGIYSEAIQRLYVAYFNRPAEPAGLRFWEQVVTAANGSTAQVSAAFSASNEYKNAYAGMSSAQVVNQVYLNLFGHPAEAAGLDYWVKALANGQITISDAVTQIASGAQGTDNAAFQSKASAAAAFTGILNTPSLELLYSGDRANQVAKVFLSTVIDDATLKSAVTQEHLQQVLDDMAGKPPPPAVFNFTPGLDKLIGTAGNDVFNATPFDPLTGFPAITFGAFDSVDGGAGNDTLNLYIVEGRNASFGSIKNIETVNVTADAATAFDLSTMQGVTTFRQIGQAGTVFELGASATAAFRGNTITGSIDVRAAAASANVALEEVSDSASLAISGAGLATATVSGSRVHEGAGALAPMKLTVTAGIDVQALNVSTNQITSLSLKESGASTQHLTSLNASRSTGDIVFDATRMPNLTSIATGSGNDTIIATKVAGTQLTIQAGAGNDRVYLSGAPEAGDLIDGGAGTNTLVISGVDAIEAAAIAKLVSNFSSIQFVYPASGIDVDASALSSRYAVVDMYNGGLVTNVGAQSLIANGDLRAVAAGYTGKVYGGNLQVTEQANGTVNAKGADLDLTVKAATADVRAELAGDLQSASVNLAGDDGHIASLAINSAGATAMLKSLTLSGNGTATVVNTDDTKLVTVDASALGGGLTYSTSNKSAETIRLGAGVDHLTIAGSTVGATDSVVGLKLQLDKAGAALTAASDTLRVTGVATTVKLFTTTQTDMDLVLKDAAASAKGDDLVFVLNGDTYVYHDNGNNLIDESDILVKLVGVTDTRAVIIALGGNPG